MAGAFQPNAFQNDAFQVETTGTVSSSFSANAVIFSTLSFTFTADAELAGSVVSDSFTSDAYLNIQISDTFSADAILVIDLVIDDFNRTTAINEIGQPSDLGHYHEAFFFNPSEFEGEVNGSALQVVAPYGVAGWYLSPFSIDFGFEFKFRITDLDEFGGYQMLGLAVPHESIGGFRRKAFFDIWDEGGGDWHLYSGGNASVVFNPTPEDWWVIKGYFDLTNGTSAAKVWKSGDPEPTSWSITQVRADWNAFVNIPSITEGQIWGYSGNPTAAGVDDLHLYALSGLGVRSVFTADAAFSTLVSDTFNADAVLSEEGVALGSFTADAVIYVPTETPIVPFAADSYLVKLTSANFTSNSYLVDQTVGSFISNAWIQGVVNRTFTAKAILERQVYDQDLQVTPLHKRVTFHVQQRRPTALSAYIPPRQTETADEGDIGKLPPDCLPPCPPYPGSVIGGANGVAIRRSIYFCDECDIYIYTSSNKMGRGPALTSTGHTGCAASHSRTLHVMKMFVDYSSVPTLDVGMTAKMVWDGDAPQAVAVKVYANIPSMPTLDDDGEFSSSLSGLWTGGDYIGTMSFGSTGAVVTDDGTVQFCHIPQSMTVRYNALSTPIFRFELADASTYYGAEFRSPNKPLDIEGL